MSSEPLIEVKNLKKYFWVKNNVLGKVKQHLKAVDDIVFILTKEKLLVW
jgi:ABC-type oligopeptide transport system ATPase subunit